MRLARSRNLWERRVAIIATFAFIYERKHVPTMTVAKILLHDEHDLIHKAVGWMLREVGKRVSQAEEGRFLKQHYRDMPRTMLRYATERFPEALRKRYLSGQV
jgi:3-methyladenine DNA glycosylase AlkD